MASSTETLLGVLFENYQKANSIQSALAEMGDRKPPTPVATDNSGAQSIVKSMAKTNIQSNRYEIILGVLLSQAKSFPRILGVR